MPVQKFRSVADMPQALLRPRLDPRNLEIACELSETATGLAPQGARRFPRGVHKYASVADAVSRREAWERSLGSSR